MCFSLLRRVMGLFACLFVLRFCTRTKNLFAGLGVDATVYELDQMGEFFLEPIGVWCANSTGPPHLRSRARGGREGEGAACVSPGALELP